MTITERNSKIVWGQCAARCCLCKADVLHQESGRVSSLVGEIAHIVGETNRASRGVSDLSSTERNEAENLLLLCRKDHKIVDDDPTKYPVDRLHRIKDDHVAWIAKSLVKPSPWRSTISQLTYINVPRLCEQAELQGFQVDLRQYKENQTLHSLGWELNHVMAAFQTVLAHLSVDAVQMQNISLHEGFIGAPIAFDRQRFRTKNVPIDVSARIAELPRFTGNLAKDPHIYAQIGQFRTVLFIDPRWITTSTAFTLFRPSSGQSTFSGLGRITGVDYEAGVVTVTPWVIGLPKGPFDELLEKERVNPAANTQSQSSLDSLVDLKRARRDDVHFHPPPTHCDLCRRSLAKEKYMIDGAVKDLGGWACMCAACFLARGRKIGWGHGQLYLQEKEGWLEVAGFPPEESSSDAF
jgi:hypothetical protein